MAVKILSQEMLEAAHEMALKSHTWTRGRSKINGREFWVVPSRSNPTVAHWVAIDGRGCTCKGARRWGDCCHAEAARMVAARERACQSAYDDSDEFGTVSAF